MNAQKAGEAKNDLDAASVATADIEALSVAPSQQATEVLQNEYQRLLAEYEGIVQENEAMESEVAALKHGKQT